MKKLNHVGYMILAGVLLGFRLAAAQPPGYTLCAGENDAFDLPAQSHIAYGADGAYVYLYNQTGTVEFSNTFFGNDPIPGTVKSGYCKTADGSETVAALLAAFGKLKAHLAGAAPLSPAQINTQTDSIESNIFLMGANDTVIRAAFDLTDYYEADQGAIFINAQTRNYFPNTWGATDGFELVRAIFKVQQAILDYVYSPENVENYAALLAGRKFLTADYFPGFCPPPADPATSYAAKINGSKPADWGHGTLGWLIPARRPTGYYLAPGSIAAVTVPASMVNKGFEILVGAHTNDKIGFDPVKRFYRAYKKFPITHTVTRIANPFGGSIYIIVPHLADAGLVDVQLSNVVPGAFFSATTFDQTTLEEWKTSRRTSKAPWADFASDKFMMQVPTSWIYAFDDPVTCMQDWDKVMDGVSSLSGKPLIRNNYILYLQKDIDMMFPGFLDPGYPQINETYNPADVENGKKDHWWLHPAKGIWDSELHEMGHGSGLSDFPGEGEALVNLLYIAVRNGKFGENIDTALAESMGRSGYITRDVAAVNWMVTDNFKAGNNMDISNTDADEVRYQERGYAKYVEIAALFGWDALGSFWLQENIDFMENTPPNDGLSRVDSRILRMSMAAGADLRPLIHFWGVQPEDNAGLRSQIVAADLKPSALIYDRLVRYMVQIPMTNAAFQAHAAAMLDRPADRITAGPSPLYGEGWYYLRLNTWDAADGAAAQDAMQKIIDTYFPDARPVNETDPPTPHPPAFASPPTPLGPDKVTMTAAAGADASGPVLYMFTKTSGTSGLPNSVWQTSPVYMDSGLTPGRTYAYTVTLRDVFANRSAPSLPVSVEMPTAVGKPGLLSGGAGQKALVTPQGIRITADGPHSVRIYNLSGRLLRAESGTGPACYDFRERLGRGVFIAGVNFYSAGSEYLYIRNN